MGEQVATNTAVHCKIEIFENETGEYYAVNTPMEKPQLIRGEYHPLGNKLVYPKKWGRKSAATILLEHKITEEKRIRDSAELELAKLSKCLEDVTGWSE
jgi:hypothetical protein